MLKKLNTQECGVVIIIKALATVVSWIHPGYIDTVKRACTVITGHGKGGGHMTVSRHNSCDGYQGQSIDKQAALVCFIHSLH